MNSLLLISKSAAAGPAACASVRGLRALSTLLDAPPAPADPSPADKQEQPGCELPALCGEPKNKLSLHRRGNRRVSYYARRKELFAHCKFCNQTGMPHEFLVTSPSCTGQCLQPPTKLYPKEYKPPV